MGNKRRPLSTSHHKTLSAHQLVVTYTTSVSTNAALYVHQTKHVKDAESGLIFFIIKHVVENCHAQTCSLTTNNSENTKISRLSKTCCFS